MRFAVSAVLPANPMARSYAARDSHDLRPVGVADVAGVGVDGVDRGEDLVAPRRLAGGEARADQGVALGDQLAVPGAAVLLVEGDELTARRTRAARRASVRSISARSPATSPSAGIRSRTSRVSRIASAVRSLRTVSFSGSEAR
jgi:hypothetical protein